MHTHVFGTDNPEIDHCPISRCSTAEIHERVRVLRERLNRVDGELEEGLEERSAKCAELHSTEQMITGHQYIHVRTCTLYMYSVYILLHVYIVCTCMTCTHSMDVNNITCTLFIARTTVSNVKNQPFCIYNVHVHTCTQCMILYHVL